MLYRDGNCKTVLDHLGHPLPFDTVAKRLVGIGRYPVGFEGVYNFVGP
jgi:hypothetical protein